MMTTAHIEKPDIFVEREEDQTAFSAHSLSFPIYTRIPSQ
jgi:hypothetical protein